MVSSMRLLRGRRHRVCVCVWRETHSGHRCHLSEEHSDSNTCRSLLRLHTCHLNTTHTYWSTAWIHSCILTVGVGFSKRSLCCVGVGSNVNSTFFFFFKVPLRENFHLGKISRYCASTCKRGLKRTRWAAFTCSWEKVVAIFVEGHSHDAVSQVKGLLDTITVVNVDVNVENSGVVSEKHTGLKKKHTLGKKKPSLFVLL